MTTIVVFGVSLFLAVFLFLIKAYSLRKAQDTFLLKKLALLDGRSEDLIQTFKFRTLQLIQSARYILSVYLPNLIECEVDRCRTALANKLEEQRNLVLGKKEIQNRGAVSFFLKKIDEGKRNSQRGEINDSL